MSFSQCRNNRNMKKYFFFKTGKKLQVQQMSFCYINVEAIFFFQILKNLQVQLMSFYYINVETIENGKIYIFFKSEKCTSLFKWVSITIRKLKNIYFFQIWKNAQVLPMSFSYKGIATKCTSPSNEFLLHRIEWKNAQVLLMSFSYKGIVKKCTSPSNEFLLHACGQMDRRTNGHTFTPSR